MQLLVFWHGHAKGSATEHMVMGLKGLWVLRSTAGVFTWRVRQEQPPKVGMHDSGVYVGRSVELVPLFLVAQRVAEGASAPPAQGR